MTASAPVQLRRESLQPLASLAMREAGADGYALFQHDAEARLTCITAGGVHMAPQNLAGSADLAVASFPLHSRDAVTGVLAFGFTSRVIPITVKRQLGRIAAAIERVWQLSDAAEDLMRVAARVAELETEVADSKIATRTRGFLQSPAGDRDVVETVARQVETLLGRFESADLMEQRARLLEGELEERALTARAKAILQKAEGLSEEEAHMRLRLMSRKTRRPVRDVALELIGQSGR